MKLKEFYNTKAWKNLAIYTKLLHSHDGIVLKCMTHNSGWIPVKDKNTHAGHLIKFTDSKSVCLNHFNVGVQCSSCNKYQGGRQDLMRQALSNFWGKENIDNLYIEKNNYCKLDVVMLDYYADLYEKAILRMVNKRGIKNPWKLN